MEHRLRHRRYRSIPLGGLVAGMMGDCSDLALLIFSLAQALSKDCFTTLGRPYTDDVSQNDMYLPELLSNLTF